MKCLLYKICDFKDEVFCDGTDHYCGNFTPDSTEAHPVERVVGAEGASASEATSPARAEGDSSASLGRVPDESCHVDNCGRCYLYKYCYSMGIAKGSERRPYKGMTIKEAMEYDTKYNAIHKPLGGRKEKA